ncbi:hypothetical protein ACVW2L_003246 [Mucilaginibacter sp. HD30]
MHKRENYILIVVVKVTEWSYIKAYKQKKLRNSELFLFHI